jgi:phosphoadenosine phosphosulfate reductase
VAIWEFIEIRGLAYPSLYDEGFGRIGCVVCPFILGGNSRKLKMHMARWPATYRVFELVIRDWFLNYRTAAKAKYPEQTPEEYLAAYYSGRLISPPAPAENLLL